MNKLVEINFNSDTKTLRKFGGIAFVGFGVMAALGSIAAFFSLVAPRANRVLYVGLTLLAFPIGFVLSYVIMGTLFFLIIGPIAVLFRLLGRDSMFRGYDTERVQLLAGSALRTRQREHFHQY